MIRLNGVVSAVVKDRVSLPTSLTARLSWGARAQGALFRRRPGVLSRACAHLYAGVAGRDIGPLPTPERGHVVVVGALAIGGAGRTAIVQTLAVQALSMGRRVAIVGHGYRAAKGPDRRAASDWRMEGDEAAAMVRRFGAQVPVFLGDRARLVGRLAPQHDLVLVDGGLFNRSISRHLTVAVLDATSPTEVLPAGPLRGPLQQLSHADMVWLHKVDEPNAAAPWPAQVRSVVKVTGVEYQGQIHGVEWLEGRSVLPIAAIGRPSSFLHTLTAAGARIAARPVLRRDHRPFKAADLRSVPGAVLVTTAKDAVRLKDRSEIAVVHIDAEITQGKAQLRRIWGDP